MTQRKRQSAEAPGGRAVTAAVMAALALHGAGAIWLLNQPVEPAGIPGEVAIVIGFGGAGGDGGQGGEGGGVATPDAPDAAPMDEPAAAAAPDATPPDTVVEEPPLEELEPEPEPEPEIVQLPEPEPEPETPPVEEAPVTPPPEPEPVPEPEPEPVPEPEPEPEPEPTPQEVRQMAAVMPRAKPTPPPAPVKPARPRPAPQPTEAPKPAAGAEAEAPETGPAGTQAAGIPGRLAGAAGVAGAAGLPGGGQGGSNGVADPKEVDLYNARIMAWLERHRRYPRSAQLRNQQGTVQLEFTIDGAGQVVSWRILQPSGISSLDRETERMIEAASPVPAPPPEMLDGGTKTFVIPIVFRLR